MTQYLSIPGDRTHELPPLIIHEPRKVSAELSLVYAEQEGLTALLEQARQVVDEDELLSLPPFDDPNLQAAAELQKYGMATNLVDKYLAFAVLWQLGTDVRGWVRQCLITFNAQPDLRPVLSQDIWPHGWRSKFVRLLEDKGLPPSYGDPRDAVGASLVFRQLPAFEGLTDYFLFFLKSPTLHAAYEGWAEKHTDDRLLPPERFHFQIPVIN